MKEKMEGMTFIQKVDYLWTYYKIWLLVPIGLGVLIYIACSAYRASQENELVSAIVVGSMAQDTEKIQEEIKEYIGKTGKNDVVRMHMNIPADQLSKTSQVALTTLIGAEAVDVLIGPRDVYEHFSGQGGFVPVEEFLGEGQLQNAGTTEKGDALKISDSNFLREDLGTPYNEVYIGVFINAPHKEGAAQFVQYVLDNL